MAKVKVSATVDPERLAHAKQLAGTDNVSEILDRALAAFITQQCELAHSEGYARWPQAEGTITTVDPAVWSELPWEDD